jgi:anti-anti-sigma regulatory factor
MLLFTNCERFVNGVEDSICEWTSLDKSKNRLIIFDFTVVTQVDSEGLVYLKELLRELQSKSSVFFVKPKCE